MFSWGSGGNRVRVQRRAPASSLARRQTDAGFHCVHRQPVQACDPEAVGMSRKRRSVAVYRPFFLPSPSPNLVKKTTTVLAVLLVLESNPIVGADHSKFVGCAFRRVVIALDLGPRSIPHPAELTSTSDEVDLPIPSIDRLKFLELCGCRGLVAHHPDREVRAKLVVVCVCNG